MNNYIYDDSVKSTQHSLGDKKHKIPWVDKYRPAKIEEIAQQDEVIKVLRDTLKTGNLPHLLFYGPPGTGKTSTILAIASELFGPHKARERVLELNASDERGINVVREKITSFAKSAIGNPDKNYPCPPYKIIILDEADAMTTEAQSALRKLMEESSKITRFCFICNYINQIIEPIASRCVKFRFKSIDNTLMTEKLKYIAENENMILTDDVIETISKVSNGDVRRGIMTLQNLIYIYKIKQHIVVEDIYEMTNMLPNEEIENIWSLCISKKETDMCEILQLTDHLKEFGYPIYNILEQIKLKVLSAKISDTCKGLIAVQLGVTECRLIEGADEYIQLLNIICYVNGIIAGILDYYPASIY